MEKFVQLIELEKDNSTPSHYSFQSYEALCKIYIKHKDFDNFCDNFSKLVELYPKVDDIHKQDTIREIGFALADVNEEDFCVAVLRTILDMLKEKQGTDKSIDREIMSTGVQFAKSLLSLNKYEELGELLDELFMMIDRLDNSNDDENLKSYRLELLVIKIQFCNYMKFTKESKKLYLEANDLNQDMTINDIKLSAIINEEGGKLFMGQRDFVKALEKFKLAFYNYMESGNNANAKIIIKYAILCSIIARDNKNMVSQEEVKFYKNDEQLTAMLALQQAYEEMNIYSINDIWNNRICNKESDPFILEHLNEILHNIRFNYIRSKLNAYKRCKFTSLEKVFVINLVCLFL